MRKLLALGDIGINLLQSGPQLGGWAATFSCLLKLLGHDVDLNSSIGRDELGELAISETHRLGMDTRMIQVDPQMRTQTARLASNPPGCNTLKVSDKSASDFIIKNSQLVESALRAGAFYYNSRGLRLGSTRDCIEAVLELMPNTVKIFDVREGANLNDKSRLSFFIQRSNIVATSVDDAPHLCALLQIPELDPALLCTAIVERFKIDTCLIFHPHLGAYGASAKDIQQVKLKPNLPKGANLRDWHEAVLAGYLHSHLAGADMPMSLSFGLIYASFISSRNGDLSRWSSDDIQRFLGDC